MGAITSCWVLFGFYSGTVKVSRFQLLPLDACVIGSRSTTVTQCSGTASVSHTTCLHAVTWGILLFFYLHDLVFMIMGSPNHIWHQFRLIVEPFPDFPALSHLPPTPKGNPILLREHVPVRLRHVCFNQRWIWQRCGSDPWPRQPLVFHKHTLDSYLVSSKLSPALTCFLSIPQPLLYIVIPENDSVFAEQSSVYSTFWWKNVDRTLMCQHWHLSCLSSHFGHTYL